MSTRDLPTGIVTFLFTDVEGSTRLVQELGSAAWSPLLARHRELIRGALAAHGGIEIQTEGDGFFAVFHDPGKAVHGVVTAQRSLAAEAWPDGARVRVRMGLHTGDGELDPEGLYVGPDVHRAARVAGSANGGQVVLSAETVAAVDGALPPGVRVRSLGEHRLKDLRPERLWDLVVDGLPSDFPAIRSLDARPNNLPTQLTSFIGRERELTEARELLLRSRLLTLTGPGGTGKTRLSLQLGADVMEAFPGGIWFVALAGLNDPTLVLETIAHTLSLPESPTRGPLDVLTDALAGKRVLLILDNMEQLVRAAPDLGALLRALPQLTIVASSQAVLRVSGEQEYALSGLPVPPDVSRLSPVEVERLPEADRSQSPDDLARYESVRLFIARAQAVRPDFALDGTAAPVIAAICARLAGMPLAIELAAARIRVLPAAAILDRLGRQLDLLASGSRDLPERQRTLRGAITWSHDLLDEPCRKLLERLGVFAGGFGLEDAEAVGGPADELGQDVLDGLGSLVDQSLLRLDPARGEARYLMLEPIREFAMERLDDGGEGQRIRDRHAGRFLEVAEAAAPHLTGPEQRRWLDRLDGDIDNLRAALDHAIASSDARGALRFVAALWRFWQIRGHLVAGFAKAREVVALPGSSDPALAEERIEAVEAVGSLAYWLADYEACQGAYEEVLRARRAQGDDRAIAQAAYNLAFPYLFGQGDPQRARDLLLEAQERFERVGDADGVARTWWGLANSAYGRRDIEGGRDAADRALDHFRRVRRPFDLAWALYMRGMIEVVGGDPSAAAQLHAEALELFDEVGDVTGLALTLDALATDAIIAGDRDRAARLAGAGSRIERSSGTRLNESNRVLTGIDPTTLKDDPAVSGAWDEGAAMDLPRIVEYARTTAPAAGASTG